MEKTAFLLLENGTLIEGKSFGAVKEAIGELVFNTGMVGYLNTLTDPCYCGQIVMQTFPLIGNYGVIPEEIEGAVPFLSAYIVRDWCQEPSNFRCRGQIDAFLKEHGIPGLYGIDTRALTRILRTEGVMNAKIIYSKDQIETSLAQLKEYRVEKAVAAVTDGIRKETVPQVEEKYRVVLWNFGAKKHLERELTVRGCRVIDMPAGSSADEILAEMPDGILISNGPGDPAENVDAVATLTALCEKKIPVFGIGLGHQLLALSNGGKTEKLKFGHRGANQPAMELATGRVFITAQNHGYVISDKGLPANAEVTFVNGNDRTCEGLAYQDLPAFSIQFMPESSDSPHNTSFFYDQFVAMMKEGK